MSIVGGIYGGSGDGLTATQAQQLADAYALSQQNQTDLKNADNIDAGTLADARLSVNVTLEGNTFNAANKLLKIDGAGKIPAIDGSQVTALHADNIATGTVANARLNSAVVVLDSNSKIPAVNGSQVTALHADNIATGTVANARLNSSVVVLDSNSKIPAYDGSQVTDLTKTQVGLGNVDNTSDANKPVSTATQTAIDAKANKVASPTLGNVVTVDANGHPIDSGETIANLKDGWQGTVATFADLPAASSSNNGHVYKVTTATGTIVLGSKKYAGSYISNGSSWTVFGYKQASVINQILSGFTVPAVASAVTAADSILTAIQKLQKQVTGAANADNISSGTLADARLTGNVTLKGNSFNGNNQLVLLNGSGLLPALNGSLLTNLPGTSSDFVYRDTFSASSNVTLLDNSYITIRFHSARKQFQFKLKSGSNYSSIGISINLTRGNDNTNRGRTTTATATNAENGYFFFTGGTGSNSNYDTNIGRNVECYVCKSSYSASHPAYVIFGGAGGNNSFWARIAEIGG